LRRQFILSSGAVRENQKHWKREQAQHVIPSVGDDLNLRTANCFASHASTILRSACDKITRRANQSKPCPALPRKKFLLPRRGKSVAYLRPSHPMRGADRGRHERAVGCGGRGGCDRRARLKRTAKSRGSGARRWRQVRGKQSFSGMTVAKELGSPGRSRSKP
jgi:hypothetical protein